MFTSLSFCYINYLDVCLLSCLNFCLWNILFKNSFRRKFIFFIFFLLFSSIWGFLNSFDGIILMFFVSEMLIILLFLLITLSHSFYSKESNIHIYFFYFFFFLSFVLYLFILPLNSTIFKFCYNFLYNSTNDIISSDLYSFFQFFFVDFYISIYYIALILTLFSIFFICFYFVLKQQQQSKKIKAKTFQILRKQQLVKQSAYKFQMRFFQK